MTAAQREKLRESLEDFVETGLEFGLGARGSSSGTTPEKVRRSEEARRSQQQEVRQEELQDVQPDLHQSAKGLRRGQVFI